MRKTLLCMAVGLLSILPSAASAETLLRDDFDGNAVSADRWHIPTWVSPIDGSVVGRTQFRFTQNASLPSIEDGNAVIAVETFNPETVSFLGTDLRSNRSFALGKGVHVIVRARMNTATPGIVGGIFLYGLKPGSTTYHDEIDFELLTNHPDAVQTNVYADEKLGIGNVQFVPYASGSITDYHTYEIKWQPRQVSWIIDGQVVRTDTRHVPAGPMTFHLNIWVPDPGWSAAYGANLQPATSASANQIFSMSVDSVIIKSIE